MHNIETQSISWKYYIPLYLIFISLLLFSTRDFETAKASPITLSNIHRILSILLSVVMIIYYIMQRSVIIKPSKLLLTYALYILIGLASSLFYSNNINYDMWKIIELFSLFLLALYILLVSNNNIAIIWNFFDKVIIFIQLLLISVLISMIVDPSNAFMQMMHTKGALFPFRLQGTLIIINALSVGTLAAFILYFYIVKVINIKSFNLMSYDYFWIATSFLLLLLSQSRTSIFGFLIALAIYLLLIINISILKKISLLVVATIFIIPIFPSFLKAMQRGSSDEVIGSLSGRATWWDFAWNYYLNGDILQKTIGFGFASGERSIANKSSGGFMNTLDSTYLSSLISTGALGTLFLIIGLIYLNFLLFKKAKLEKFSYRYTQAFGISIILFIKTFTTGTINILTYYALVYVILIVLVNTQSQKGHL